MTMAEKFKAQLEQKIALAKSSNDQESLRKLDALVSRASQYLTPQEIQTYRNRIGIYRPVKKYSGLKRLVALGAALAIVGSLGYGIHKMSKTGLDFGFLKGDDGSNDTSMSQMSEEDMLVQQFMEDPRTIQMLDELVAVGNSIRTAGTDISAEQVLDLLPLLARDSYSYKANGIVFAGINNAKRSLDSSLNVSTDAIFRYQQMVDFSPLFEGEEKEFFTSLNQIGSNYMEALANEDTTAQKDLQAQYNALVSEYFSNINDSSKSPFATAFAWVADSFDKVGLTLTTETVKQFGESAGIDCESKANNVIFQEAAANFYKLKGEEFEVGARTATSDGYFRTCISHAKTVAEEIKEKMIEYISKRLVAVVQREAKIGQGQDPEAVVDELNRTNTDQLATPAEIAGAIDTNGDGVLEIIQQGSDYSAGLPTNDQGQVILEQHTEGTGQTAEENNQQAGENIEIWQGEGTPEDLPAPTVPPITTQAGEGGSTFVPAGDEIPEATPAPTYSAPESAPEEYTEDTGSKTMG